MKNIIISLVWVCIFNKVKYSSNMYSIFNIILFDEREIPTYYVFFFLFFLVLFSSLSLYFLPISPLFYQILQKPTYFINKSQQRGCSHTQTNHHKIKSTKTKKISNPPSLVYLGRKKEKEIKSTHGLSTHDRKTKKKKGIRGISTGKKKWTMSQLEFTKRERERWGWDLWLKRLMAHQGTLRDKEPSEKQIWVKERTKWEREI